MKPACARPGRRYFRDVDRNRAGREADAQADDDAPAYERPDRAGRGANDRSGDKDQSGDNQHEPPAKFVRQPSSAERADRGSDQHDADDQFLMEDGEVKLRFDEDQGARNDARVITKQKPAHRGENRRNEYEAGAGGLPR